MKIGREMEAENIGSYIGSFLRWGGFLGIIMPLYRPSFWMKFDDRPSVAINKYRASTQLKQAEV